MTFRITIFSQEVEDFVMEAKIDAEAKFLELHNLILNTCNYQDMSNHGFLICDDEWRVKPIPTTLIPKRTSTSCKTAPFGISLKKKDNESPTSSTQKEKDSS